MAEGIIFAGFLLSKNEFIEIYKQYASTIMVDLNRELEALLTNYNNLTANAIYTQWDIIQKKYFAPITIMGVSLPSADILAGGGEEKYEFSAISPEIGVLGGNNLIFNKIMQFKQLDEVQNILNLHYNGLVNSINSNTMNKEEAKKLHIYLYYQMAKQKIYATQYKSKNSTKSYKRSIQRYKEDYTGQPYSKIYGAIKGAQLSGKQLDAFFNHMGGHHPDIFDASGQMSVSVVSKAFSLNKTVYAEEGAHFMDLLLESLNTTPWYTGGDIVVIDETGAVIYNIQLKSSTNRNARFNIATKQLKKQILTITQAFQSQNIIQAAEAIYEALKTNSANEIQTKDEQYFQRIQENIAKHFEKQITINI